MATRYEEVASLIRASPTYLVAPSDFKRIVDEALVQPSTINDLQEGKPSFALYALMWEVGVSCRSTHRFLTLVDGGLAEKILGQA